jgi:hypothetical protein
MSELDFITDMVEEKLVKGNLRWLANFNEIHRDYTIGDITFPIYASGSLQEKGFLLSRLFSALVTPKYKIHFFLYTSPEVDPKFLRKMILAWKNKFGEGDWVFLELVQSQSFGKTTKEAVESITDKNIGIAAYSLTSKETLASNNVLGRNLSKQLKLTEAKFEAFDLPNYLKSFVIILALGILFLIFLYFSGLQQAISTLTLLFMTIFSLIVGYPIYKTRYHTTLSLNNKGFLLRKGKTITEGKWSSYTDATIYVTPQYETCLRLHSKDKTLDLPLSRVGLSRKDVYNAVRELIKRK